MNSGSFLNPKASQALYSLICGFDFEGHREINLADAAAIIEHAAILSAALGSLFAFPNRA